MTPLPFLTIPYTIPYSKPLLFFLLSVPLHIYLCSCLTSLSFCPSQSVSFITFHYHYEHKKSCHMQLLSLNLVMYYGCIS